MVALLIIGVVCLALCYPVMKFLERRGSRWSNLALVILMTIGIVCLGFFAGLDP